MDTPSQSTILFCHSSIFNNCSGFVRIVFGIGDIFPGWGNWWIFFSEIRTFCLNQGNFLHPLISLTFFLALNALTKVLAKVIKSFQMSSLMTWKERKTILVLYVHCCVFLPAFRCLCTWIFVDILFCHFQTMLLISFFYHTKPITDTLSQSAVEGQHGRGYKPLTRARQSPSVSKTPIKGIKSWGNQ